LRDLVEYFLTSDQNGGSMQSKARSDSASSFVEQVEEEQPLSGISLQ
jgi:hypothetical protein